MLGGGGADGCVDMMILKRQLTFLYGLHRSQMVKSDSKERSTLVAFVSSSSTLTLRLFIELLLNTRRLSGLRSPHSPLFL